MWWKFTKKIQSHPEIASDEEVFHACYGLGAKLVEFANRSISRTSKAWDVPESSDGLAASIDCNGVVALTDRRLCFFPKVLAIGTPKAIKADWPINVIDGITYAENQLRIEFKDGSVAELHVPSSQSPGKLVAAFLKVASKPR
jgi:hypothetical protein